MAIAFDNQSPTSLTFSELSIKDIHLGDSKSTKLSDQYSSLRTSDLDGIKPNSDEAKLFQQLLSPSMDTMLTDQNTGADLITEAPPHKVSNLPHTTANKTVINQTISTAATINSVSTAATSINVAATIPVNKTVGQITNAISGSLNSLATISQGAIHSFSVLIPGQANLNVSTQIMASGVRSLQLDSDEKKFQSWLQNNLSELSQALSKQFEAPVHVCIGAIA